MEHDQNITSSSQNPKSKQKWKASAAALGKNEKSKASKTKSPSEFVDGDHRSTLKRPHHEREEKNTEVTLHLAQMTLDEGNAFQSVQRKKKMDVREDEETHDDTDEEEPQILKEARERNMDLEEKLAEYDQSDICGALDLSSLHVTDNDIPLIFQRAFRRQKKRFTYLVLRDNALTSAGVKILGDKLLKTPTSLRNLCLSSNPGIGDDGLEHLVRLLRGSRSITILGLHNTGITDRGVHLLADVLCDINPNSFSPLEKLYISFNKSITDDSLEPLIQILQHNQTLRVFSMQRCSLSDKARRRLRYIGTKKKKRKFSLSD